MATEAEKKEESRVMIARIDERTCNIYTLTEKQEAHLERINGSIGDHSKQIAENKDRIATSWKIGGMLYLLFLVGVGALLAHFLGG